MNCFYFILDSDDSEAYIDLQSSYFDVNKFSISFYRDTNFSGNN